MWRSYSWWRFGYSMSTSTHFARQLVFRMSIGTLYGVETLPFALVFCIWRWHHALGWIYNVKYQAEKHKPTSERKIGSIIDSSFMVWEYMEHSKGSYESRLYLEGCTNSIHASWWLKLWTRSFKFVCCQRHSRNYDLTNTRGLRSGTALQRCETNKAWTQNKIDWVFLI